MTQEEAKNVEVSEAKNETCEGDIIGEIIDPTTGVVVDVSNQDDLIDALENIEVELKKFHALKRRVSIALTDLTTLSGVETKTRHVAGDRREVEITMPDDYYDQSKLREVWNSYPDMSRQYLRIEKLAVQRRNFKKAMATSGTPAFETFKKMIEQANMGPTGIPYVKIKK
jgi:hypothetical protein